MKNKKIFGLVLLAMCLSLGTVGFYYWYQNNHYVATDDARVTGTVVRVSPRMAGKIIEINFDEGDVVRAGQVVARLDDTALPKDGNIDLTVVRSPVSGTVISRNASPGEMGAPGQPMLLVVDPTTLYVRVNVEESVIGRVQTGQHVELKIDSIPGRKFKGTIEHIGDATLSVFSLLPQSNNGGNFTKVIQRVPVKVRIDDEIDRPLQVGTNVSAKIHIR